MLLWGQIVLCQSDVHQLHPCESVKGRLWENTCMMWNNCIGKLPENAHSLWKNEHWCGYNAHSLWGWCKATFRFTYNIFICVMKKNYTLEGQCGQAKCHLSFKGLLWVFLTAVLWFDFDVPIFSWWIIVCADNLGSQVWNGSTLWMAYLVSATQSIWFMTSISVSKLVD